MYSDLTPAELDALMHALGRAVPRVGKLMLAIMHAGGDYGPADRLHGELCALHTELHRLARRPYYAALAHATTSDPCAVPLMEQTEAKGALGSCH